MAGTSFAYAQSTVEIYGIIDQAVGKTTGEVSLPNGGAKLTAKSSGLQSGLATQRIGFRGTEDLGGGNKAVFQIESALTAGVAATNENRDANGFGTRPTFVGLSNTDLGTLTLGRQDTPLLKAVVPQLAGGANNAIGQIMWSPFSVTDTFPLTANTGATADATATANAGLGRLARATTINNAVNYKTPTIGGVSAELQYGQSDVNITNNNGGAAASAAKATDRGWNVAYANGPLTVNAAGHTSKAAGLNGVVGGLDTNHYLGATYALGTAVLSIQHGNSERSNAGVDVYANRGNQFGVKAPIVGNLSGFAAYGKGKRTYGLSQDGVVYKQKSEQLGLAYAFSKRTTAYAVYGTQKLTGQEVATGEAYREKQTVFGLNHTF